MLNKWLIIHNEDGYMLASQVRDTFGDRLMVWSPTSTATIVASEFSVIKHCGCPANLKLSLPCWPAVAVAEAASRVVATKGRAR
jgi:hypothetical protein